MTALIAAAVTAALVPVARYIAIRLNIVDMPRGARMHRRPTPYLGGCAVWCGLLAASASIGGEAWRSMLVCGGALLLGLVDDIVELSPKLKFTLEVPVFFACVLVWTTDTPGWLFGSALMALAIVVPNSVNFLDNMDANLALVAATSFVGLTQFDYGLDSDSSEAALAVAAACLAFLPFNLSGRIKIFMGDAGSLVLGVLWVGLAADVILARGVGLSAAVLTGCIFFVPLLDTLTVFVHRIRKRRGPLSPGADHLSHRVRIRLKGLDVVRPTALAVGSGATLAVFQGSAIGIAVVHASGSLSPLAASTLACVLAVLLLAPTWSIDPYDQIGTSGPAL